jgi:hypothetical protein
VCKIQDGGKDALATLIWSPGLGHVQRGRFSRPRGREPEEGA